MNAKKELLGHIEGLFRVKCIQVDTLEKSAFGDLSMSALLKIGYTQDAFQNFLSWLDFDYDNSQKSIEGFIWYEDGTYSKRVVFEGSECWNWDSTSFIDCPEVPKYLARVPA
jgi:hypothetical protein